ncbi:MAG: hypothetical protein B6D54_03850, partial [Epsilonproteobacteria bacterium 4484_65]
MEKLIIATRASNLALWQAYHIKARIETSFPEVTVELNEITSKGDKILDKPLALIGGKGHFTKELEDEMIEGNAHLAVHSLKDVPTYIPEGLELCAITTRQDLLKDIPFVEKLDFFIPPMGQAALGIEIVSSNDRIREIAMTLNDENSFMCTKLERD